MSLTNIQVVEATINIPLTGIQMVGLVSNDEGFYLITHWRSVAYLETGLETLQKLFHETTCNTEELTTEVKTSRAIALKVINTLETLGVPTY